MKTEEKLFVQIFERKKRILDQVKDQILQFDHYLASKCIIEGFDPPNWLLSPAKSELSKEDLISGLLLPQQKFAVPCPGSHASLYKQLGFTVENRHLPDSLCTGDANVDKENDTAAFTQRHCGEDECVPKDKPELERSVTSPKDCLGPTISGNDADLAPSLARIQRSKCRQKALALRNSAKAANSSSTSKKNFDACDGDGQVTGSKVASLHLDMDEAVSEKPLDRNLHSSAVNKENTDPCQSNGRPGDIDSGRITRSRSSAQVPRSVNGSSGAGNTSFMEKGDGDTHADVDERSGGVKSSICDESRQMMDAKPGDYNSSEKEINADSGRLMRSSSSQQHKCVQEDDINNLNQQPDNVTEIPKINTSIAQCQMQDKIVDQSNGTVENCAKPPCISLTALDHEVTGITLGCEVSDSGPVALNKSPLAKSSKKSEEFVLSCHKVKSLPCTEPDRYDAIVEKAHSASSTSKSGSSDKPAPVKSSSGLEGDGLEVSVSSLQPASPLIVKPKQLDFYDMEECCLVVPSVSLEKKKEDKSSERKSFMPVCSSYGQAEVTPSYNLQKSNSELEVQLLDEGKSSGKEGTLSKRLCITEEETCKPAWGSNSKAVSSTKERDGVPEESNISFCLIDHSVTNPVAYESSSGSHLKEAVGTKVSTVDADREIESSLRKSGGRVEVEISVKVVPTGDDNSNISGGHDLVGAECARASSPDLVKNADEAPCTVPTYEAKGDSEQQKIKPPSYHIHHADSSIGRHKGDENDMDSVPTELNPITDQIPKKSMQSGRSSSSHTEGSSCHKRRKIESPLTCLMPASSSLKGQDALRSNDKDKNGLCNMAGGYVPSSKLPVDEGKSCLVEKETNEETHFASIPSSSNEAPADSQVCLAEETMGADQASITSDSSRQLETEESQISPIAEDKFGQQVMEHLICEEGIQSPPRENGVLSDCSLDFSCRLSMELLNADQSNPVYERFAMPTDNEEILDAGDGISIDRLELPKTSLERASLLEQLCRSACIQTPFSSFSTSYELHKSPNAYHSVPKGLLECMGMGNVLSADSDSNELPKVGTSSFSEEVNLSIHAKSFPISNSHPTWDIKKPYSSPVGKLWDRFTSYSSSSEKRGSTIPELPCITEENENMDESADAFQDGDCSEGVTFSVQRNPLTEIKEDTNVPPSFSEAELCSFRNSLDSVTNDYSATCSKNSVKRKAANRKASNRRDTNRSNGNLSMAGRANGTKRASESVSNRFSKPKLSGKQSLRKGPSFSGKKSKVNNIVTHTTSFISLLPQKPVPGIATGKRDVNVKALGAAEAARRQEEKKENERKMKKEALKLERARLEQENQKQLELQKKKKEEERKKKEAEMAARKRQREEEEKLEKERKRKRIEETKKQRQEAEEKLRAKKDEKDSKVNEIKARNDQKARNKKMENEAREDKCTGKVSETKRKTTEVSTIESGKLSGDLEDHNAKVSETEKAAAIDNLTTSTITILEESYDISPYKGSDDEDEEDDDDDVPNKKFIPSWASKRSLASVVASQKELDPGVIFPPDSFCSIDSVLLPRKLQVR